MKKSLLVKAPATSANLGPGFDCLGLALSLFSEFRFTLREGVLITGCPEEFKNRDNLVYRAFCRTFAAAGEGCPGVRIDIRANVPLARGLGSSSTCIAAGIVAANRFLSGRLSEEALFSIATELEGHPDNAAPCLFGGLTASFQEEGRPRTVRFTPHPDWRYLALIPDYEVKTEEARGVLRQETTLSDSVFSVSHAIAMLRALETGDEALLSLAAKDVLHEPYRKRLIPDYDRARELALANGAAAFLISGSGSTMLAPVKRGEKAAGLFRALTEAFPAFQVRELCASMEGTSAVFLETED